MFQRLCAIGLLACQPYVAFGQTATSCVDQAWTSFRQEVENKADPMQETGNAYLVAYGWVRATQACLDATTYPSDKAEDAASFRDAVDRTAMFIEQAIRTDTAPSIFALGQGADGIFYTYPDAPPAGGPLSGMIGEFRLPAENGMVNHMDSDGGAPGLRMLSMREMAALQALLTRMGFDTGGVDGIAGPRTFRAIARYQRSVGADPTGVLTSRQIDRLLQ